MSSASSRTQRASRSKKEPKAIVPRNSPLGVMYVEVNNSNFTNAGCYSIPGANQAPLFDIGIIFAANINFDTQERRAYLHYNENVTRVLNNKETFIRPLQEKGIKILLSILGNHEGAGVCNFENEASARDFAIQLRDAVITYGLDGIDFDDEYSDYGNNGTGQPNAYSFLYLLRELRALMPDKIISFYYYGPASSRLEYQGLIAGTYLNYSWNAIYGTYYAPNVPGLNNSQLGPAAVDVQSTSASTARSLAERTVADGYGVYLYYNLPNNDINSYLSGVSNALYGTGSSIANECLQTWPPGKPMRESIPTRQWTETEDKQRVRKRKAAAHSPSKATKSKL